MRFPAIFLYSTILILSFPGAASAQPVDPGTKVNRFQLVARALRHPGLYTAAVRYIDTVGFPKNDVLTCYWDTDESGTQIRITNVLPGDTPGSRLTRTIFFTRTAPGEWEATELSAS